MANAAGQGRRRSHLIRSNANSTLVHGVALAQGRQQNIDDAALAGELRLLIVD
jgi:hypothetical protein